MVARQRTLSYRRSGFRSGESACASQYVRIVVKTPAIIDRNQKRSKVLELLQSQSIGDSAKDLYVLCLSPTHSPKEESSCSSLNPPRLMRVATERRSAATWTRIMPA